MKNILLLFLLSNVFTQMYAQGDVSTAKWIKQPVIIDGINSEWGSLNFYDDETRLSFGIANDSNNIYLCFESTDEPNQMKIMRAGIKVMLITKGKPKHESSILFPLPQSKQAQMLIAADRQSDTTSFSHGIHNKESFRQNFIVTHSMMEVSGFTSVNGDIPIKDSTIKAAINWDSASDLIYEIAIAKREFFGAGFSSKESAGDITLSVEINALHGVQENENKNGDYQGTGGMHGGGMRGGGGRHGGGFNQDKYGAQQAPLNNVNRANLNSKTSFKQKFVLNNGNQ